MTAAPNAHALTFESDQIEQAQHILFGMESAAVSLGDLLMAIMFICEGGEDERAAAINAIAIEANSYAAKLAADRQRAYRILSHLNQGPPAVAR